MKNTFLITLLTIFSCTAIYSQKILKTESGQRILLVENGSWRVLNQIEAIDDNEPATDLSDFNSPEAHQNLLSENETFELKRILTNLKS